jgi:hypothetical protein
MNDMQRHAAPDTPLPTADADSCADAVDANMHVASTVVATPVRFRIIRATPSAFDGTSWNIGLCSQKYTHPPSSGWRESIPLIAMATSLGRSGVRERFGAGGEIGLWRSLQL